MRRVWPQGFGCSLLRCGFGLHGTAVLLLQDLVEHHRQAGDGGQQGPEDLGVQGVLAGQGRDARDLILAQHLAVHEGRLDLEGVGGHLLGEVGDDAEGSDGVAVAGGERGRAVQHAVESVQTQAVQRQAGQGVLDDGILHVVLPQLAAERGILRHGDAPVVHEDAAARVADALSQLRDDGLLLAENFCVRHCFGFTSG